MTPFHTIFERGNRNYAANISIPVQPERLPEVSENKDNFSY